jgi:GMP synthase PP-ATPase subunit
MLQQSLTSKQLSLLYALCNNKALGKEFTSVLQLSKEEIAFLIENKLIEEVIECGTYIITSKGINSIKKKHVVVYSMGSPYAEVFASASESATNKMLLVMIDQGFFDKTSSDTIKTKIVEELIINGYFNKLSTDSLNELLKRLVYYSSNRISCNFIAQSNELFKSLLKYNIEIFATNIQTFNNNFVKIVDGTVIGLEDFGTDFLINVYNSIYSQIKDPN